MATCNLTGLCGKRNPNLFKQAIEDPVLAPWVEVAILNKKKAVVAQASGTTFVYDDNNSLNIRVGNCKTGSKCPAAVKSFQLGISNGSGATVEIVDQEGGDFKTVFDKLTKGGTVTDSMCYVRWGWISTQCNGQAIPIGGVVGDPTQQPQAGQYTPFLKYLIQGISLDYSSGIIKYTLNLSDQFEILNQSKIYGTIGTIGQKEYFVNAVKKICAEQGVSVRFVKYASVNTPEPLIFNTTDTPNCHPTLGILGTWPGDNRSVMECFKEWLGKHKANDGPKGRGIQMIYDSTAIPNGGLVFMVDMAPIGTEVVKSSNLRIASYVVNGGNCTPVISFKPQITVGGTIGFTTGGTGGGSSVPGTQAANGPQPGLAEKDASRKGTSLLSPQLYNSAIGLIRLGYNVAITLSRNELLGRMRKAIGYAYDNMFLNNLSNSRLAWNAMTAELRVQGDPTYCHPVLLNGKFVNLVVINPFQVGQNACRWENSLQPCNEILSNENWVVQGVSHDIREGSYTTTIKLSLPYPGSDISILSKLGATGTIPEVIQEAPKPI